VTDTVIDVGRSTHLDFPAPRPLAMLRKRWHPRQYQLADMAADTAGLLDALALPSAHLVGASMGGMIAQTVAARYPNRVQSLTSIMSTTGAPHVGRPALSTWLLMLSRPARSRAESADRAVRIFRHIGSAGYPGHDLPDGAWPALVNLIDDHIRAAAVRSADGQES
jgi:pimeloyl-ACP methyl ester carboxylesterase